MKKIISLFTGLSLSYVSFTQLNLVWAKNVGGTSDVLGQAITTDAAGNVYTAGVFWETADFDSTSSLASAGNYDVFISKMDASGNFVWAKSMGGKSTDIDLSIAVDDFGNVYTTGDFWGTADFDPGPGIFSLTSAGNYDVFISKLDASGNFVWAKNMGGPLFDVGYSIAVDGSGNVYAIGSCQDTADFDPGNGIYNLESAGSDDIFITKLNSSGNFVWAKNMGGSLSDVGHSIALDGLGNVYSTGWFYGTVDFDPSGKIYTLTSAGEDDVFISIFDA